MDTARNSCSICGMVFEQTDPALTYCPQCHSARTQADATQGAGPKNSSSDQTDESILHPTIIAPTVHLNSGAAGDATRDSIPRSDETRNSAGERQPNQIPTQFGRFLVQTVLGQGAFGIVYRAYDPLLDREVALKVPRFALTDATMLERFYREAKSAARLHHPNIVTLHETGIIDGVPYLVSEFVNGTTLLQVIREKRFDIRTAVDWIRQVAEALHYAHSEGVVHRDIKPGNIMINGARRPQIMDFGLAKRVADGESNMTVEGQILGTPNYMSPEQARGLVAEVGPHSDQYSVGVVLYEMLCGSTPFVGRPVVVVSQVADPNRLPTSPRKLRPGIPRDLEASCLKAIEKDPRERYPDLQAFADDLDHWLKGLPLTARPLGPVERLGRWCRKNRMIASLTGTLAAIMLILAVGGPWLAFRFQVLATRAEHEANAANAARQLESAAREKEQEARLDAERILVDNYTESGLTADRNRDPHAAILWFSNAIAAAASFPERERHNRIRMQSWLSQFAIPILAFPQQDSWNQLLAYHPAGNALLSLSNSGFAEWMDLTDGQQHPLPLAQPITAVAWSHDGKRLAAASRQTVVLYDHPAGAELCRWDNSDAVVRIQFSPNDEQLFLGGHTTVQIHDILAQRTRPVPYPVQGRVRAIEISPDGRRFAARTDHHRIFVFSTTDNPSTVEPILPVLPAVSEGEILPVFVTNDRMVFFNSDEQAVCCWDIPTRSVIWRESATRVLAMAVSPDRRWVAVGDNSNVLLLDVTSDKPLRTTIKLRNLIHGLGFHPGSHLLLATCNDDEVQMFDVHSGTPACAPIPHNSAAHRCVWAPDGLTFATVNWGGHVVRVWRPPTTIPSIPVAGAPEGPFIRFNPAGDRWISSSFDGHRDRRFVTVHDSVNGAPIGPFLSGAGLISDADFIPESPLIVLAGGGLKEETHPSFKDQKPESPGTIRFVNSTNGQATFPDIATPTQPIAVRASPDGKTVVVLCHHGQILIVDAATGKVRHSALGLNGTPATHGYVIRDRIRISPRGDLFAVWGSESIAEVRDLTTGQFKFAMRHPRDFVHDVQFSPDGSLIASCSSDQTVCLWNSTTGARNGEPLPHPGWIFSAQFTGDGKRLLTACDDRHARVWDIASRSTVFATHEQPDQVFGVCSLPGDEFFLTCDRSGQLSAWESRTGKMIAPTRRMTGMVYQLSLGSGTNIVASGRLNPCQTFRWDDWIMEPKMQLTREEMKQLGEILSAQRIHDGGAVTNLTCDQWMSRWQQFHVKQSIRSLVPN